MAAVLVSNLSPGADEASLREFFSYSGAVSGVELREAATTEGGAAGRTAVVRFASADALATALLLSGATMAAGDAPIVVTALVEGVPAAAGGGAADPSLAHLVEERLAAVVKAGHTLAAGALEKAKELDAKAGISASVKRLDEQLHASERANAAAAAVKERWTNVDERFKVSASVSEAAKKAAAGARGAADAAAAAAKDAAPRVKEAAHEAVAAAGGFLARAQQAARQAAASAQARVAAMGDKTALSPEHHPGPEPAAAAAAAPPAAEAAAHEPATEA